jgi:hypothetical protein
MATTATALIGTNTPYDTDVNATHLARLVEGDRAVWVLTDLNTGEVARWFPHRPDRIGVDLWALVATQVIRSDATPAHLGGEAIRPTENDDNLIDGLGETARSHPNLLLVVTTLPGSSLIAQVETALAVPVGGAQVAHAAVEASSPV